MSMIEQPVLSQPTDSVSVNAPVMLEIDHKTVHLEFHPESKKWNSVVRMTLYHEFSDMGDDYLRSETRATKKLDRLDV